MDFSESGTTDESSIEFFFLLRFDLEENLDGENVGETTTPKSSRIYRNRPADESFPFSTIDFK